VGWDSVLGVDEVVDISTFEVYARQNCDLAPSSREVVTSAGRRVAEMFDIHPHLDWRGMCNVVSWARDREKRFPHLLALVDSYRFAYADGYLPQLRDDSVDELSVHIERALEIETDLEWRRRLANAFGGGRRRVFDAWLAARGPDSTS
jgi:hypothetical protein